MFWLSKILGMPYNLEWREYKIAAVNNTMHLVHVPDSYASLGKSVNLKVDGAVAVCNCIITTH
jgi:hypothetical protein